MLIDGGGLLLVRHGQSVSNAADVFTGWSDPPLSPLGVAQARQAGTLLRRLGLRPTSVHTSLLRRSIATAAILMAVLGCGQVPVYRSWRLNERHYGALTGRDKRAVAAEVDAATFRAWRRSYATGPPPISEPAAAAMYADPRYAGLSATVLPRAESLADVRARTVPYWSEVLRPLLLAGGTPLVVGHGNSLRALVMHLEGLSVAAVEQLDIPTAVPMLYHLDPRGRAVTGPQGRYLDPVGAAEPIRVGPGLPALSAADRCGAR
ncbi:2,3-bisphosphoglycerate-dependent phosphoglycerate mutase [Actinoplanes octamycinicus]|uniref:2,3-bisphosphoglycerate-dependent phosphoglycerate mutase n=1 Tax=Actinoplanes octamycinicus TaxID=135948 RepID=A0A7W7H2M8_9ACTN|nr:2,3-bisphosphoglycerate-dependent phosphoglycerate mutase [Actinoplanes octamycinicus]MBB4742854.1 2,3-bisphosphoglycerate-dependent phosphoglycerate mutase [Actinoplanes octamycinicus]GIE58293.1 2,3-bisphosphoglycerate-dependent phosphoglycerate mutase [Actinoplanes octamycinicus]